MEHGNGEHQGYVRFSAASAMNPQSLDTLSLLMHRERQRPQQLQRLSDARRMASTHLQPHITDANSSRRGSELEEMDAWYQLSNRVNQWLNRLVSGLGSRSLAGQITLTRICLALSLC
jgi:hypothetical protein